ncbi:probable salivary secreted peptide [Pseudomyrmex gracilis]|uniref:probable salivary secreted peptide n=1 Tax=Pseudomyrmex gracilis TaxID=219809 RepID=UPI000995944B|nr:probable salivary secreted peptide [Pseudomyrmex gracilis]
MSSQKYMLGLAFVIAALVAVSTIPTVNGTDNSYAAPANKSHHLIVGYRMPGDRLVLRQNIVKNSSWMKVQTVEKTFNASQWERITLLRALDQKTNGNGAYASIVRGGPGHSNVTIKFKSQRGHGINFIVELHAR